MYIKKTKLVSKSVFNKLEIAILASDKYELQIQVEKSSFEDFFFDLSVEQAIALRNGIDKFIAGRSF